MHKHTCTHTGTDIGGCTIRSFLLSVLLLCANSAIGHVGSIRGIIKDAHSGLPLNGANIYIKEHSHTAVADAFGAFLIRGLEPEKYWLVAQHLGYQPIEELITVEEGVTTELTIYLKPGGVQLSDVTINARKDANLFTIADLDLKLRPVSTAQDLLRMVPGLFIAQHQGGGKAEQIFLRGFDIDHGTDISINVDGMPVNMVSHAHGQGYADLHFLIPELLDNLSFGKGPYQIDKGNFATAGWVDFKTKDYLDSSFVQLEGGSFGYARAVTGIKLLGKTSQTRPEGAYLAGEFAFNRSFFDRPQNLNRVNLTGKYTRQLSSNSLLSVSASGFRSDWDASGQIPERAVAAGLINRFGEIDKESGATSRYNLNVQYTQAISPTETFKSNIWASYYDFSLYSNFTFFLRDSINGDQIHQAENRFLAGYNADYTNAWGLGKLNTRTRLGAGFRHDATTGSELSHTRNMSTVLAPLAFGNIHETNAYAYINQTFFLLPNLVANFGTRFDLFYHTYTDKLTTERARINTSTSAFSPKAGLYYNIGNGGRLYFNYGIGFHSNDTRVVVPQQGHEVLPLARSADIGIVLKPVPKLLIAAALFHLDLEQEFVYVGDEAVVEQGGGSRRQGADLSLRYEAVPWLYFDADLNYTNARLLDAPSSESRIPLAPSFTSGAGVTVRHGKHWSGSLRYRYLADRPANESNTTVANGYQLFDLALNYSYLRYSLGLQIQNLFDIEWKEAQFETETRLRQETASVSEICFTPGTPFFIKIVAAIRF